MSDENQTSTTTDTNSTTVDTAEVVQAPATVDTTAEVAQTNPSIQTTAPVDTNAAADQTPSAVESTQVQSIAVASTPAIVSSNIPAGAIPFPEKDFEGYISWIKSNGNSSQKEVVRVMEEYIDAMAPRKIIDDDSGAKMQYRLFKMMETVLNNAPSEEFKPAWNTILAYFNKYQDGCFNALYVNRFAHAWAASVVQLTALQRLINLIRLTCNSSSRAIGLKQVDLDATTSEGFTPTARQRILEFYRS